VLSSQLSFPVDKFVMLMKLAVNKEGSKLKFSDKGLLGVEVNTEYGVYHYYLRQMVR